MPLNIVIEFLTAVIELLRLSLIVAIPCFVLVLAARKLHAWLAKRFSLSWAKATLVSTYLIVTLLIIVLYLVPLLFSWMENPLTGQAVPPELQPTLIDLAALVFFTILRIVATAAAYTVLLLPFIFFATFVNEKLEEREKPFPGPLNIFITVFVSSLLAWIILLFIFPFVWGGLFYLLYWG